MYDKALSVCMLFGLGENLALVWEAQTHAST